MCLTTIVYPGSSIKHYSTEPMAYEENVAYKIINVACESKNFFSPHLFYEKLAYNLKIANGLRYT